MLGTTSSRDQAIETYRSLLKKKKDLTRKNRALQTKIAQFARKHKVDLCGNIELSETSSETDAKLYNDLLDQLKNVTYDKVRFYFIIKIQYKIKCKTDQRNEAFQREPH